MSRIMKREIVYPELSYKIIGILFNVYSDLGRYRNEKQYGDLIEQYLKELSIPYEREKVIPISFDAELPGRNKVDFLIDDKVVLEIKAERFLEKKDYYQMMRYLQSFNRRLGILVNFHQKYLQPKRIINGYEKIHS